MMNFKDRVGKKENLGLLFLKVVVQVEFGAEENQISVVYLCCLPVLSTSTILGFTLMWN